MPLFLILLLLLLLVIFCFRIPVVFRWIHHFRGTRPRTPSALESGGGYAYRDPFKSVKEGEARTLKGVVGEIMGRREGEEMMLRGGSDGSESPGRVEGLGVWRVE